mgnify:CR=1 FL=1
MSKKYNYAVVRTITNTRLMYAENDQELRELYSEGIVDQELSFNREYEDYTFYRIDSDGETMVPLLDKDIFDILKLYSLLTSLQFCIAKHS